MAKELRTSQVVNHNSYYGITKKQLYEIVKKFYVGSIPKIGAFKYRLSKRVLIERIDYSDWNLRLSSVHYIDMRFVRVYVDIYDYELEDFIHNEYIYRF